MKSRIIYSLIVMLNFSNVQYSQTDTLIAINGDVLAGEIKSLKQGVLIMKTDYSNSDFQIEWEKVKALYTHRNYVVFLATSKKYFGNVKSDINDNTKLIIAEDKTGNTIITNNDDIIYLDAIERDFLSRLDFSLDLGFTLTKANNLRQFTTRTELGYLTSVWEADLLFNMVRNFQKGAEPTRRTDGLAELKYFMIDNWFLFVRGNFLQNDEQKLKLRSTGSAGIGNFFIYTNKLYVSGIIGSAWTNESFDAPEKTNKNSLEGVMGLEINFFNMSDLELFSNITLYPGITEPGRFRTDFRVDLKYDLPFDFYIRLGYTLNYDNKPAEGASENDYVLQTAFGWEL
jgi:hypothetical protein